ncbi:CPBP family intramembrane glutamic endopeptidase [Blastococcus sp. SYSU D01042]
MTIAAVRRARPAVFSGGVVLALVIVNVTDHTLDPPWWVRALEGAGLLAAARLAGLSWAQLGLGRARLRSGCAWGAGAVAVVAGVYCAGVLLPLTRSAFQDDRYDLALPQALHAAFVAIPLGTVLLEELAFRSVLWGALARHCRPWQVLVTTSVLFGLWHLIPALRGGVGSNRGVSEAVGPSGGLLVVAGTLLVTTVGGLVFGELRRRSGSVLASAAAHWATNALGVLVGLVAWHLERAGG